MQRGSAVLGRQRGLGEAARSWGGSAVLGVSPMSDCRGSPHSRFAVVSPTRALPFPQRLPVRSWGGSAAKGGPPHSRFAVVSPTRAWDQEVRFIFVQVLIDSRINLA
ncbi:MAG: hypothetical protein F6K55_05685 [Moorea sp. SIO4A3]|nr:hypothetical protein [Moorena sp. SIO4A3]